MSALGEVLGIARPAEPCAILGPTRGGGAAMKVRVHGGMTVAQVKREDLADDVASVTSLGGRSVSRRLDGVHGKTHLRVAFSDVWPAKSVELGAMTSATALHFGLEEDIAGVIELTARQVRGRLKRVDHGKTLVRTVFAAEWPAADDADDVLDGDQDDEFVDDGVHDTVVHDLSASKVAGARLGDMAQAIADRTGLSVRQVNVRLRGAHGNVLLANLFATEWGDTGGRVDADDAMTEVIGTRVVGERKVVPLAREGLVGGRFRLLVSLGKGGQGEAFEARDEQFPERGLVVIKFASFDTVAHEFKMAMLLHHDHICRYMDVAFDADRNRRYLVIEHGGRSLSDFIAERGPFSHGAAIAIISQAADALDYAHGKDVIHHDVSPGNILMDAKGRVRVTDFGISVAGTVRTVAPGQRTVVAGTSIGRHPFYAAPEMSADEPVRRRADQYSLALVLCSLLEGEVFTKPYHRRAFQRLSARQNTALRRALSRNAEDRFRSCAAFVNELKAT